MPDNSKSSTPGTLTRRELLKLSPLLAIGAFAIPRLRDRLLTAGVAFTDWASARWFRRNQMASTFADSELTPLDKFYVNTYDVDDPEVDLEKWTLTVSGDVKRPGQYTLAEIQALPKLTQNTRHICVEGWDVIGRFGGARIADFLLRVGANLNSKFLYVECADDYYESLDMASALHPQSLLCYEMYDRQLTREHGAPLRLRVPTKIGYKQAKYLTSLRVTNVVPKPGYWEDQNPVTVFSSTPSSTVGDTAGENDVRTAYGHPWAMRFCHWLNTVSLFVMAASGLRIFRAFPSFGPKIPERDLLHVPGSLTLGGWLGGGLQWHMTFAWIYVATGVFYFGYQILSGNYRQFLFVPKDLPGVWAMIRHYFFFGRKPAQTEVYNPLQKMAYTSAILLGLLSIQTGIVLSNPVLFSFLASLMGGFHWARVWHFCVLCALLLFVLGHLIMVILHGRSNFTSMLTGWKGGPEYLP
jgi:DMSO/TMAO reductase YedYZ molybdopterin-dependent catalytic subunit/thiosulfate reductase cytochrome b subunit